MGMDVSVVEAVLLVAALLISGMVVAGMSRSADDLAGAFRSSGDRSVNHLRSGVAIINDPGAVPSDPILVYVKNTGTDVLDPLRVHVMYDGVVWANATTSVLGGGDFADPGDVIAFTLPGASVVDGTHRIHVKTGTDTGDSFTFVYPYP